jgi:selenocysteine lyase/cysteine desulfurase
MNRRDLLSALGGLGAARALGMPASLDRGGDTRLPEFPRQPVTFPRRDDFDIEDGLTYLNAAYTHPIPRVSVAAASEAAARRGRLRYPPPSPLPANETPRALFASLINATPDEIAYVSSTSAGENLVVRALGLDRRRDGNVVTDGLHFEGALMHLRELKQRGLDVRVVAPTADARIDFAALERVVDRQTRLIEVSATSMYNGFQHDLKAVADLAHAHGAYVYVDAVHAIGAEPFDVRKLDIDFASCSSFKWLMGDFGLGFLYVRRELLDSLERPVVGYYQAAEIEPNYPPVLPDGQYSPVTYSFLRTAAGMFEMGALVGSVEVNVALLASSLRYVKALGVEAIQAHRITLMRRLQQEVPRLGFTAVTPANATGGNITFARRNLADSAVPRRLQAARVNVRLAQHWMRISPSVYNDMRDVERLLEALA